MATLVDFDVALLPLYVFEGFVLTAMYIALFAAVVFVSNIYTLEKTKIECRNLPYR